MVCAFLTSIAFLVCYLIYHYRVGSVKYPNPGTMRTIYYSILLPRSSDYVATHPLSSFDPTQFDPTDPTAELGFSNVLDTFYPDQSQRMLIFDLIQTLWDRADPNGYATHMTASAAGGLLEHTPDHHVLLQIAWGDHQVANVMTSARKKPLNRWRTGATRSSSSAIRIMRRSKAYWEHSRIRRS